MSLYTYVSTVAPEIITPPVDVTLTEGESAVFMCRVTGRPRPRITWGYLPLMTPPMITPRSLNGTIEGYTFMNMATGDGELESTLTVISTLPSDTGFYICRAENEVMGGLAFANASLTVQGICTKCTKLI